LTEQPEKMIELVKLLQNTQDEELDCDEFWERAAWLAQQDLTLNLEELRKYLHHLELCPGCAEEFALLKDVAKDLEDVDLN